MNFYYDNKKRLKLSDILMERVHDEPPESSDESDSDESMEESDEETKDGRCERCGFEQTGLQKSNHHDRFLCDSCAARFSVAVAVTRQKRCRGVLKRVKPMKNFVPGADMIDAFSTLMKNKTSALPSNGQSTSYEQPQYQNAFEFEKSGYRDVFREQRRRRLAAI
ncbi:unnamed protein product [Anisakis simplex]|uniref:Nuclear receptor domain-containing protein n=1 Tax=Anisakis simplex TaxID=6269 RepID=A0A0M3JAV5_ANISI|nr:unnamed protein product [Anisakis simplex]